MEPEAWNRMPKIGDEGLFPSTPARLLDRARNTPGSAAYAVHDGFGWVMTSWADYHRQILEAAKALISADIGSGDSVCILGFNRPQWTIMAHAAMMIGARPAGIYWTAAPAEIGYILDHSEAPLLLIESAAQADDLAERLEDCSRLRHVVVMDHAAPGSAATGWDAFMESGSEVPDSAVQERLAAIEPAEIGTLIYTSGTTGPPKAVMLSHGALAWTAEVLCNAYVDGEEGRGLSYLPLAHIAEQQASVHCHPNRGSTIYFARSMETLADDIRTVRPTTFFGVPRVWEKMAAGVEARLQEARPAKKRLAGWAMSVNERWHLAQIEGRQVPRSLSLQRRLATALVTDKVKAAMGLDAARTFISGAAPISPAYLRFFCGLDMPIVEGYGQSETAAPISSNLAAAVRHGSVGRVFDGIDWRISEEGELQVKGPGLFSGYLKDAPATEQAYTEDGWLKTGDIVTTDEEGFITIKGRIKDILITSGGKNVTPSNIEAGLMDLPLVEHAVVVGDGRHYLTALMTLSQDALTSFAAAVGKDRLGPEDEEVIAVVADGVKAVNAHHARVEHIRKFRLLTKPLTIEGGDLTPTMKVKRRSVIERHTEVIEAMYAEPVPDMTEG